MAFFRMAVPLGVVYCGPKTSSSMSEGKSFRGRPVATRIPRKEFLILQLLLERAGQVVSREELKERAWGEVITPVSEKTLDVHVRRLRSRIERDPSNPDLIRTVRGTGYVFDTRPIPMGTADVTQAI